ncbi:GldL-related protein [Chitinophaga sp. NPDC101104]|uniref:GldL-related protein n=1 Tax=Chitinophaga sp. NPDC101104 TaxID=3390561 RepID=UPI003CFEEB98
MKILYLILSLIAIFVGAVFKILHWPNANILLFAGLGLFLVFHLMVIMQIFRQQQFRFGNNILWLALAVSLPYLGSILFLLFHPEKGRTGAVKI